MSLGPTRIGTLRLATFVAALAFVLQAALAFATPPVQRDIFGNVICAPGTMQTPAGSPAGHKQDCCFLSCNVSPLAAAGMPPAAFEPAFAAAFEPVVHPPLDVVARHDRRTPANPRAPPPSA